MLVPARLREVHGEHREAYFEKPRTRPMGAGHRASSPCAATAPSSRSRSASRTSRWTGRRSRRRRSATSARRASSEREKALEEQLDRARRLESVGQLAGGIAHDFNNILGVIMNYAEFVADELEPDSEAQEDVEEIRRAAERAAALTRQLLIFSRREVVKPEVLDLAPVVGELENLLRRALGERVEMTVRLDARDLRSDRSRPQPDRAGPGQPRGQRAATRCPKAAVCLIEAENVDLDEEYAYMHPDTEPGPLRPAQGQRHRRRHGPRDDRPRSSNPSSRPRATAPGWGWPPSTASSPAPAVASTSTRSPASAPRSRSTCRSRGGRTRRADDERRRHPCGRRSGEATHARHRRPAGGAAPGRADARRPLRVRVRERASPRPARSSPDEPFQLALCDIQMPGESGLVLVEEIAGEHPETAIVLVTGVDDPEIAERAFELGAQGYLVKPFWPGQLLITTASALRQRGLELAQEAHSRTLEDRIQTLMDAAPVPIYIKDSDRRYVIANKVAHEVAGLEAGRADRPRRQRHHDARGRAHRRGKRPHSPRGGRAPTTVGGDDGRRRRGADLPHGQVPLSSTTSARSPASPGSPPT